MTGNGQGVLLGNAAGTSMNQALISKNLFNGLETGASINLLNMVNTNILDNVMNQDNSIVLTTTNNIIIIGNTLYQSVANGILVQNECILTRIIGNIISSSSTNGVSIISNNTNIFFSGNCIDNNTNSGIVLTGPANSIVQINNNNIRGNTIGLLLNLTSYTAPPPTLDANLNYWDSPTGPNYNGGGPGTGQPIIDNNIMAVQTVDFDLFISAPIKCPLPIDIRKTSTSINVPPGLPISFDISLIVPAAGVTFVVTSFFDPLPSLVSGFPWTITAQNLVGFFNISGLPGAQQLNLTSPLPAIIPPGTYTATISANTNIFDAGDVFINLITASIQIGGVTGLIQTTSATATATATASVAICIHSSSRIKLANNEEMEISKLQSGEKILGADNKIVPITESVPCWAGVYNTIFTPCVIFEKDSLSPGIPNYRFAVDSGHPICTPEEYFKE